MVMHLVSFENKRLYRREMQLLFRARKEVFVDDLGWQLAVHDGLEIDEYDDDLAKYVIGFDSDGDVAMSVRFRPTLDRSLMMDHFAHVLPSDVRPIADGRTWEVSRGFCREMSRKRPSLMRKAACMITPLEVALAAGMDRLVGFSDVRMLTFFVNIGWKLTMLGDAVNYGEGDGFAYEVEVSEAAVQSMRQKWGLPNPAHIFIPDHRSRLSVHEQALRRAPAELRALAPVRGPLAPRPTYFEAARLDTIA